MNECWCLACRQPMVPVLVASNGSVSAWTCYVCGTMLQPAIEWNPWTQRFDRNTEPLLTYGRTIW